MNGTLAQAEVMSKAMAKRGWWQWYRCPLVPEFKYRPGDDHNTPGFHFHWLFFRAWSCDAPQLGFEVKLDDREFEARLILPYCWAGIFIPVFPQSVAHKFWRKSQRIKRLMEDA